MAVAFFRLFILAQDGLLRSEHGPVRVQNYAEHFEMVQNSVIRKGEKRRKPQCSDSMAFAFFRLFILAQDGLLRNEHGPGRFQNQAEHARDGTEQRH